MLRVRALTLYGLLAASTRYRYSQFQPILYQAGIDLQIHPLLGDEYLSAKFAGRKVSYAYLFSTAMRRLSDMATANKDDLTMLHCEAFPYLLGGIESRLLGRKYVYDFDDAFYFRYQSNRHSVVRYALGNKFESIMSNAVAVTAGSEHLCQVASRFNKNATLIPTVVDINRYLPRLTGTHDDNALVVGWIGSPSTAKYLNEVIEPLATFGKIRPTRLIVVGGRAPRVPNVQVEEVEWSEASEIALIQSFDIGIMPLTDDEWTRGKCAFKLIQYMACGVPVIGSRVGANIDVVSSDCGFLATSAREWVEALQTLSDNASLRWNMGDAGRARVLGKYSLQRMAPVLEHVLKSAASG